MHWQPHFTHRCAGDVLQQKGIYLQRRSESVQKDVLDPVSQLLSNELTLLATKWPLFETQRLRSACVLDLRIMHLLLIHRHGRIHKQSFMLRTINLTVI